MNGEMYWFAALFVATGIVSIAVGEAFIGALYFIFAAYLSYIEYKEGKHYDQK